MKKTEENNETSTVESGDALIPTTFLLSKKHRAWLKQAAKMAGRPRSETGRLLLDLIMADPALDLAGRLKKRTAQERLAELRARKAQLEKEMKDAESALKS